MVFGNGSGKWRWSSLSRISVSGWKQTTYRNGTVDGKLTNGRIGEGTMRTTTPNKRHWITPHDNSLSIKLYLLYHFLSIPIVEIEIENLEHQFASLARSSFGDKHLRKSGENCQYNFNQSFIVFLLVFNVCLQPNTLVCRSTTSSPSPCFNIDTLE